MHDVSHHTTSTGLAIALERFSGEVVNLDEQHVTTIHQGKQILPGEVRPGYIESDIETIQRAWLRSPEGVERQFDFSRLGVQTRVGHQLVVVSGSSVGNPGPMRLLAAHNVTTTATFWNTVGGVDSANNDLARATWFPGVFMREWRRFAAVGAIVLAVLNVRNGFGTMIGGAICGAVLGSVAWVLALVLRLSPARRRELKTYPEIEELAQRVAEAPVRQPA